MFSDTLISGLIAICIFYAVNYLIIYSLTKKILRHTFNVWQAVLWVRFYVWLHIVREHSYDKWP